MSDSRLPYQGLAVFIAIAGIAAVAFSAVGLYTVLTGGPAEPTETTATSDIECETFDGDPAMPHEDGYGVDRTVFSGVVFDSADATVEEGFRLQLAVDERVLEASASTPDGRELAAETHDDDRSIVVEGEEVTPFRLWVDTVDEDARITRTQVDICLKR